MLRLAERRLSLQLQKAKMRTNLVVEAAQARVPLPACSPTRYPKPPSLLLPRLRLRHHRITLAAAEGEEKALRARLVARQSLPG
jgi:hypothetical protein